MITIIKLKPDVIEFLDMVANIQIESGVKSYMVNEMVYSETKEKNVYIVSVLDAPVSIGKT
tara:strand:- start:591 stop:773 length:183 start_codon:yes stop_codon:yes gene_type:complete